MNSVYYQLTLQFTSPWLSSTGQNIGRVDATSLRDEHGLPYLPTSQIKGMWLEASTLYSQKIETPLEGLVTRLFGKEGAEQAGNLQFLYERAVLDSATQQAILQNKALQARLFITNHKTARDKVQGTTKAHTKRALETVVPMPLVAYFSLSLDNQEELQQAEYLLEESLVFFNKIAANKYRGLGKVHCVFAPFDENLITELLAPTTENQETLDLSHGHLNYRITPHNRSIVTQDRRTTNDREICDYFPGNILVGIAANQLYGEMKHAGVFNGATHIVFSNAYPVLGQSTNSSLPQPFALHKLKAALSAKEKQQRFNRSACQADNQKQLAQCRVGYLAETQNGIQEIQVRKGARRQTANENRVAKPSALFDTQWVEPDYCFQGKLSWNTQSEDETALVKKLVLALQGIKKVGANKSEGYGTASIEFFNSALPTPPSQPLTQPSKQLVLWALSDLALLDEFGQPCFTPNLLQLGFNDKGRLDPAHSFIRTHCYSPYNGKRGTEPQRQVITKGSVLVYQLDDEIRIDSHIRHIGLYTLEGLGQVWINPPLLFAPQLDLSEITQNPPLLNTYRLPECKTDVSQFLSWLNATKDNDDDSEKHVQAVLETIKSLYQDYRLFVAITANTLAGPSLAQWSNALSNYDNNEYTAPLNEFKVGFGDNATFWTNLINKHGDELSQLQVHQRVLKRLSRGLAEQWRQGVWA